MNLDPGELIQDALESAYGRRRRDGKTKRFRLDLLDKHADGELKGNKSDPWWKTVGVTMFFKRKDATLLGGFGHEMCDSPAQSSTILRG